MGFRESIIELFSKQSKSILSPESADLSIYLNIKYAPGDLSFLSQFLPYVIAEIDIGKPTHLLCTSYKPIIDQILPIQRPATKQITKQKKASVFTYDIVKNKPASISGKDWKVVGFITIDLLRKLLNNAMKNNG